jgi:hypothetical protein
LKERFKKKMKQVKGTIWLAGLALLTVPASGQDEVVNLISNAGFEAGVEGWNAFNGAAPSTEGDPVLSGSASLKLDGTGGNFSVPGALQTVDAAPGDVIHLGGYMLTPEALPADATFGTLKIVFSDGSNDLLPAESALSIGSLNTANPGMESLPFINAEAVPGEWVWTEAQAVAPEGTTEVSLFALNVNQSGAVIYADDLVGTRVSLVENAHFEAGVEGWTVFNGAGPSGDDDPVYNGIGSLKLDGTGGNYSVPGAFQSFAAAPGDIIHAQGYMMSPDAIPEGNTFGTLKIVFSDGNNDLLPVNSVHSIGSLNTANPGMESLPFVNATVTPGEWALTEAQAVAPPGTVSVSIFALNVNESGAVLFADNIIVKDMTPFIDRLPWDGVGNEEVAVSPWFGSFTGSEDGWINHTEQGWLFAGFVESPDSMWFWSDTWDSWTWSSKDLFPIVFDASSGNYLYYFIVEDVGVYVLDYATFTWTLVP